LSKRNEAPLNVLESFLPEGTYELVTAYIIKYKVHLTLTRERQSVLGDYRHPDKQGGHRISINGNLNAYAFLLTLLHEIAHLQTFLDYGWKVASHGKEWKKVFGKILHQVIGKGILPHDVEHAVLGSIHNPGATHCTDEELVRVLKKYDKGRQHYHFVEVLHEGELFRTKDGRIFKRGEKIRKRYRCQDIRSKRIYLFSPVYEVEKVKMH